MGQYGISPAMGSPTLWCTIKCGATCLAGCVADGPGPLDIVAAAYGFVEWGGK